MTNALGYQCQLYDDLDGYEPSIKDCKSFIRLDRQLAKAFGSRGFEFYELGQYKRAIRDYDQAIRMHPSAEDYNNRGLAHLKVDNIDIAFDDFQPAAPNMLSLISTGEDCISTWVSTGSPSMTMIEVSAVTPITRAVMPRGRWLTSLLKRMKKPNLISTVRSISASTAVNWKRRSKNLRSCVN